MTESVSLRQKPTLEMRAVQEIVDRALEEDIGWGDVTTEALIDPSWRARAIAKVKVEGVIAGLEVFALAFHRVDAEITVSLRSSDGARVKPGDVVARVDGAAASILKAERVALNFLQRMSGIATMTSRYVEAISGHRARVIDTRKTTPGLRLLEKYALRVGGGSNHRFNLSDGVLIKDNHLEALAARGSGLREAIAQARARVPHTLKIEVEVESVEQALEAVEAGADVILLDNMPPSLMREVVERVQGRVLLEASGGITLENVRAVAETGVDLISSGALTHSAQGLDISLDFEPV